MDYYDVMTLIQTTRNLLPMHRKLTLYFIAIKYVLKWRIVVCMFRYCCAIYVNVYPNATLMFRFMLL